MPPAPLLMEGFLEFSSERWQAAFNAFLEFVRISGFVARIPAAPAASGAPADTDPAALAPSSPKMTGAASSNMPPVAIVAAAVEMPSAAFCTSRKFASFVTKSRTGVLLP